MWFQCLPNLYRCDGVLYYFWIGFLPFSANERKGNADWNYILHVFHIQFSWISTRFIEWNFNRSLFLSCFSYSFHLLCVDFLFGFCCCLDWRIKTIEKYYVPNGTTHYDLVSLKIEKSRREKDERQIHEKIEEAEHDDDECLAAKLKRNSEWTIGNTFQTSIR